MNDQVSALPGGEGDDPLVQLMSEHQTKLEELAAAVGEHSETLTWLVDQASTEESGKGSKPVAWCWRFLDETGQATLWTKLREFVDWLNLTYFVGDHARCTPGCWYRHPQAVEEFTAVWAG